MPDSTFGDAELHEIVQRVLSNVMGSSARAQAAPNPPTRPAGKRMVAIGADHSGFELKGILKRKLRRWGLR